LPGPSTVRTEVSSDVYRWTSVRSSTDYTDRTIEVNASRIDLRRTCNASLCNLPCERLKDCRTEITPDLAGSEKSGVADCRSRCCSPRRSDRQAPLLCGP